MAPIRLFGLLVTILLVSGPSFVKGQGPYPNTPCVDTMDCDPVPGTTQLQCIGESSDKKCSCAAGLVFHYNQNKCLLVAISACTSATRQSELTPNSECDQITNKVTCETGYLETANRKCAMPLGGACKINQKDDCDHDMFAICKSSKCQCPVGAIVEDGTCKLDRQSDCVPYDPRVPGPPQMLCPTETECEEKVLGDPASGYRCTGCPSDMVEDENGNCVVPYEGQCIPGDPSERPCDVDAFLECDPSENKCLCQDPDKTWFNNNKCQLLLDEPCQTGQECTELMPCATPGTPCGCGLGADPSADKQSCLRHEGAPCDATKPCNTAEFLICDSGICTCEVDSVYLDRTCKLLLDVPCEVGRECAGSMPCTTAGEPCACGSNAEPNPDKKSCKGHHGAACDTKNACDSSEFLVCGAGATCDCESGSWYNNGKCQLLLDQPCQYGRECTELMPCDTVGDLCSCGRDADPSPDKRFCLGHEGAPCNATKPCNAAEFLTCDGGYCACEANSVYNDGRCELLLGQLCQPGRYCIGTGDCGSSIDPCTCGENAESRDDHTCLRHAGANCSYSEGRLCNAAEFLVCSGDKCECAVDSWYNPRSQTCELLQGEYCNSGSNSQPCTEFSMCSSQNQTCVCLPGYTPALNGTCILVGEPGEPSFGAPCEHANDCSREDYLECGPDKTCECHFDSWFNPSSEKCELLVRSPCIPDSYAQACTEFADCTYNSNAGYICLCSEDGFVASTDKRCVHQSCGSYNRKLTDFVITKDHYKNDELEPLYGTPCDHANDCSREDYLECGPDKTCECHFDSWFNSHSERCELLVRSPCIPDSFAQACTEYSECTYNTNAGFICLCNEDGFVGSADKRCVHQSCGVYNGELKSFLMPDNRQ